MTFLPSKSGSDQTGIQQKMQKEKANPLVSHVNEPFGTQIRIGKLCRYTRRKDKGHKNSVDQVPYTYPFLRTVLEIEMKS